MKIFALIALTVLLTSCETSADNSRSQSTTPNFKEPPTAPSVMVAANNTQLPYTNLDVAAFKQKMKEPGVVLIDVRTPQETAQGKIEGAKEIDFLAENFEIEIEKLDPEKTYLVYCRSGNRSAKACALMASKGFKYCYNLLGGYNAWIQQQ